MTRRGADARAAVPSDPGPDWVFAYGSLMWNPGFEVAESRPAVLHGHRRAPCILSHHYRGTPRRPGLLVGLDLGGACRGIAHRIPPGRHAAIRAYLRVREIENDGVYVETARPVRFDDGSRAQAVVYLADRAHPQYAGPLDDAAAARLIRQGTGATGSCLEYFENTVAHLDALGLRDRRLHRLLARAKAP